MIRNKLKVFKYYLKVWKYKIIALISGLVLKMEITWKQSKGEIGRLHSILYESTISHTSQMPASEVINHNTITLYAYKSMNP
jgi:hypothetical protein